MEFFSSLSARIAVVLIIVMNLVLWSDSAIGEMSSPSKNTKLEALLGRLNKPAVKTIESEDGDIIDCVDIHNQPAFDHPLLKNHTIQMRPSIFPEMDKNDTSPLTSSIQQTWQKSGSCPEGTIPIRRTRRCDLLRAVSLEGLGRMNTSGGRIEYAGMRQDTRGPFHGVKAFINVWGIYAEPNEWTNNAVVIGDKAGVHAEAGWTVNPEVFGDAKSRLYAYWTTDDYRDTGCYNLLCPGFVQLSNKMTLGASLAPLSVYDGLQYGINPVIYKDPVTNNWWLTFGTETVGYWPAAILKGFSNGWMAQWAATVMNRGNGGHHTMTRMGSGHYAQEGERKAAEYSFVYFLDDLLTPIVPFIDPSRLQTVAGCYSLNVVYVSQTVHFFYGGPGGQHCDA